MLAYCDIFFVWAFTAEMIMKLIGLGLRNYLRDKFNIFDGVIVILSLVDFSIVVAKAQSSEGTIETDEGGIFSAFRALRLLRVVKLAR